MKTSLSKRFNKGFTLIELLVVIGILAVLLAIVLVAINPARQFAQANDTQRRSDVNAILNAVHQYGADNNGDLTALNLPAVAANVSTASIDICALLVSDYLAALPVDPTAGDDLPVEDCAIVGGYETGYQISVSATNNRVTVAAPTVGIAGTVISVTK